jgi:dTDP-4-amino-4,6-dideoxygalactose transaminase
MGRRDQVIVQSMKFIATSNAIELVGAKPVFIDCNLETLITIQLYSVYYSWK